MLASSPVLSSPPSSPAGSPSTVDCSPEAEAEPVLQLCLVGSWSTALFSVWFWLDIDCFFVGFHSFEDSEVSHLSLGVPGIWIWLWGCDGKGQCSELLFFETVSLVHG